eukprot:5473341-Amphidinium_carterae.1
MCWFEGKGHHRNPQYAFSPVRHHRVIAFSSKTLDQMFAISSTAVGWFVLKSRSSTCHARKLRPEAIDV